MNGLGEARHLAGMTQAEVARRLGRTQAQVSRIETRELHTLGIGTVAAYLVAVGADFSLAVTVAGTEFTLPIEPSSGMTHRRVGVSVG